MPNAAARPRIQIVAAVASDGGIGRDNALLVRIADDMKRFRRLTLGAPVIMGRKTWQSIGRALPGRLNIVVTRDPAFRADGATVVGSLDAALSAAGDADRVSVIGGAELYALALASADVLELTEIDAGFAADTFFPAWDRATFTLVARESRVTEDGLRYDFATYERLVER